eukprot:13673394-Alexandrium_andersonii.AAC.1
MPTEVTNKYTQERQQRRNSWRNDGGMGLACDTSGRFNLEDFLRAFIYWRQVKHNRPLGTPQELSVEDFVAMVALNQGDGGRGGKVRFLFGALMAQPSDGDLDDPCTPMSALSRCISINW